MDHAVFISDLMIKRTEALQAAAKHEKDKVSQLVQLSRKQEVYVFF